MIFQLLDLEASCPAEEVQRKYQELRNQVIQQKSVAASVSEQIRLQNRVLELDDAYLDFQSSLNA
jgi:hypothetical protein